MFKDILVVLQGDPDLDQKVLARLLMPANEDAHLTLLIPVRNPLSGVDYRFLTPELRHQVRHRALTRAREQNERHAAELRSQGYQVRYEAEWVTEGTAELLCEYLERDDYELVLMMYEQQGSHHPATDLRRFLRLNQHSHTWLMSDQTPFDGPILAAVDTGPSEPEHEVLGTCVIRDAAQLAERADRPFKLVTAIPDIININNELREILNVESPHDLIHEEHQQKLEKRLTEANPVREPECLLKEGEPDDVVIAACEETGASLLVLGRSPAPGGLRGIWRTTLLEKVLGGVHCDLMIVPSKIPV